MPQDEDEVLAAFSVSLRGGPMDRRRGGSRNVADSTTSMTSLGEEGMSILLFEDEGGSVGKDMDSWNPRHIGCTGPRLQIALK
jgi:hypothetical protein